MVFLGYNIPLTITIDGKYTSNTIKISYDLPLIQNVQQRGNSQICNVTGVYLSKVIGMTVITGLNMKTNITKMNSTSTLEEHGFYIESNNTIFILLPNNTQPCFMELIINDGAEYFRAPRFNFKITPTITDGQSFQSDTPGDDLKIKGIFMRTSESGGPMCIHSKDGDGLSFTCVLKSGFGSNHTVNIYYNLLQIGTFNVSYNPPQLTGVFQEKNGNIKINGYNLGDSNLEILIDGKPCTQHEIDIHTYSSVSCNVTNYAEMLKHNYTGTKFNISISVDGQYFIAEIFQFKYESTISYGEKETTEFPIGMYVAYIFYTAKENLERYWQEKKQRSAFRNLDNLHLKVCITCLINICVRDSIGSNIGSSNSNSNSNISHR
ncbi:hypothetical protein ACTFIY_008656 [Dictyostelium cf. discoideum]